ncbi:AraC family transcriptional regulator [Opitutaceae bacterium TAV5]|nr:AraC family transcriptional regulator [Opitutaceae bacterium TAV5]
METTMETTRQVLTRASDNGHQLEECRLIGSDFVPAVPVSDETPTIRSCPSFPSAPGSGGNGSEACDFLVAIGLSGSTRWRLVPGDTGPGSRSCLAAASGKNSGSGELPPAACECVLGPDRFAAFVAVPGLRVARTGEPAAHFLLWRFRLDMIHAVLGHTPPAGSGHRYGHPGGPLPVDTWPMLGPAPASPELRALTLALRTAHRGLMQEVWYGSKLLELLTLIHPEAAPEGASCPVGTFRATGDNRAGDTRDPGDAPEVVQIGSTGTRPHPAVERAVAFIRTHYTDAVSLPEIATAAGVSPSYLSHLFSRQFGEKLASYLRRIRVEHAARLLERGDCNVTEAAMAVGYNSLAQFNHTFRALFGYPPGEHRRRVQTASSRR